LRCLNWVPKGAFRN